MPVSVEQLYQTNRIYVVYCSRQPSKRWIRNLLICSLNRRRDTALFGHRNSWDNGWVRSHTQNIWLRTDKKCKHHTNKRKQSFYWGVTALFCLIKWWKQLLATRMSSMMRQLYHNWTNLFQHFFDLQNLIRDCMKLLMRKCYLYLSLSQVALESRFHYFNS